MALRAVTFPDHPSWESIWSAEELAEFLDINTQTIYAECKRGAWDFALIPGTGTRRRFSGFALAARFGVPGYGEGVEQTGT
jgi:hypothetical protein